MPFDICGFGEWMNIETAPKDGTRILLTSYKSFSSDCPSIIDDYWYQDRVQEGFDHWDELFDFPPTHWMPMPKPPKRKV